jgi:hypothetical protein
LLSANIADDESALFLAIRFAVTVAGGEIAFFPLVSMMNVDQYNTLHGCIIVISKLLRKVLSFTFILFLANHEKNHFLQFKINTTLR